MELEISKHYSCSFHPISPKLYEAPLVEYRLSLSLASGQILKILWHFEILTWGSMGKS